MLGTSCSMFHDDLDPCKQKANINLTFTKNMQGSDLYDSEVHCAQVLLYDSEGNLYGHYPYNPDEKLSIMLPPGNYHAVAYGGAVCGDADIEFNLPVNQAHQYTSLETSIKGTRGGELAKDLHNHFHAMGDFTVQSLDYGEVNHTLDLVKNNKNIQVILQYTDGRKITGTNFRVYITGDNTLTDHANNIIKTGTETTYRPFDIANRQADEEVDGVKPYESVFSLSTGKMTEDTDMVIHIERAAWPEVFETINIAAKLKDLPQTLPGNLSLKDYLERQDTWTFHATIEPDIDKITIISLKINGWNMVLNDYDF